MENLHMNIYSALLFLNEMQIKIIMLPHSDKMAKIGTILLAVVNLGKWSDYLIISFVAAGDVRTQSFRKKS